MGLGEAKKGMKMQVEGDGAYGRAFVLAYILSSTYSNGGHEAISSAWRAEVDISGPQAAGINFLYLLFCTTKGKHLFLRLNL
jgi:hypothetical protein